MPRWFDGSDATLAPMPKLPVRLFSLPRDDAMSQMRSSSGPSVPGREFQIVSFGLRSVSVTPKATKRSPLEARRAASSAFMVSSRIIMVLGQRSMRLATRNSSSAISSAATALDFIERPKLRPGLDPDGVGIAMDDQ